MICIYGVLSVGVHLHLHYCCGKIKEVRLAEQSAGCCHQHGDDHRCGFAKDCCAWENVDLKIEDSHQAVFFKVPLVAQEASFSMPDLMSTDVVDNTPEWTRYHIRPPSRVPLFIRYQSLVLYA